MKVDIAYSLDFEGEIDVEKAYDLYWIGIIKDKHNFECPDPNCNAQITCANLDKPIFEIKNVPHFKVYGQHSSDCEVIKSIKNKKIHLSGKNNEKRNIYLDSTVDILLFDRPQSHSHISNSESKKLKRMQHEVKINICNNSNQMSNRNPEYCTIKPLVSKYERFLKDNTAPFHKIDVKGYKVKYSEMFVQINAQDYASLSKYLRIYFGEANIYRKEKGYQVRYKNTFRLNGQECNPSIYISDTTIEKHYMHSSWKRTLDELVNLNKRRINFFLYSKPTVNEEKYINLPISKMDFFDYRFIEE